MAHIRKQIRDGLVTSLTSDVTLVSGRVYGTRVFPLDGGKLPCVAVYTLAEASGLQTMGVKTLRRDASIVVEAYIRMTGTFDDDADALAVQIEESIASDTTIGGIAKDAILTSTEIDFSGDADTPIGVARLTYSVVYVSTIGDVETAR